MLESIDLRLHDPVYQIYVMDCDVNVVRLLAGVLKMKEVGSSISDLHSAHMSKYLVCEIGLSRTSFQNPDGTKPEIGCYFFLLEVDKGEDGDYKNYQIEMDRVAFSYIMMALHPFVENLNDGNKNFGEDGILAAKVGKILAKKAGLTGSGQ